MISTFAEAGYLNLRLPIRDHIFLSSRNASSCSATNGAQPALAAGLHPSQGDGLCWIYLSTVLDDLSRYITAWNLCTTMKRDRHAGSHSRGIRLRPGRSCP